MIQQTKRLRVLVAEDDEDHLFLTVRALLDVQGVHLEIEGVRDGEEALDYVYRRGRFTDRDLPHLIFLDIRMPKVDGLEVLQRIKDDPELTTIPVVMLTGSDRPEDVNAAYDRGSNSYVTKPTLYQGLHSIAEYWTIQSLLPSVDPPNPGVR
jgi:CheY-like chemotaxis protein